MTASAPQRPQSRPRDPRFSSGPTVKRPGWTPNVLADAVLGRSHRGSPGKAKLREVIERSRALLGLPQDHLLGILPGSDTGAMEAALWSLLGARGVDVLAWESFGKGWARAMCKRSCKLEDRRDLWPPTTANCPTCSLVDPAR